MTPWVEDEQSGSHYEKPRQRIRGQIAIDGLESIHDQEGVVIGEVAQTRGSSFVPDPKPLRSEKQLANDERLREMAKKRREDKD